MSADYFVHCARARTHRHAHAWIRPSMHETARSQVDVIADYVSAGDGASASAQPAKASSRHAPGRSHAQRQESCDDAREAAGGAHSGTTLQLRCAAQHATGSTARHALAKHTARMSDPMRQSVWWVIGGPPEPSAPPTRTGLLGGKAVSSLTQCRGHTGLDTRSGAWRWQLSALRCDAALHGVASRAAALSLRIVTVCSAAAPRWFLLESLFCVQAWAC
jgi:hypothetical protein